MAYLTIELKTNDQGGTAAEVLYTGTDIHVAEQKYYQTLAVAATSGRPRHACVILDSDGMTMAQRSYVTETEGA
jgi:hypothetical protein